MAMIVQNDTYRVPDGSYAVGCRVMFEPKTSLYEANIYVNGQEVERGYFDDRKTALVFANSGLMDLWLNPVDPLEAFPEVFAPATSAADDTHLAPHGKFRLDAEIDAYIDAGGHMSHDPARCGCGDCLTHMAGEVYA